VFTVCKAVQDVGAVETSQQGIGIAQGMIFSDYEEQNELTLRCKKNYADGNLREVARQKVAGRQQGDGPKYRDRASERRIMHNQPETPLPGDKEVTTTGNKKHAEGPAPPSPPAAPVKPSEDENNVGNKLLKMMGWKEGTGLGTDGEGRVEPM
jgi:RNA-binding protein 5/10